MSAHCKLHPRGPARLADQALLPGLALLLSLAGCLPAPRPPGPAPAHAAAVGSGAPGQVASAPANLGQPYDIDAAQSLLTVLVWPAGSLSAFGHSHVIASHDLRGTLYLPVDPAAASARVEIPVDSLTVDEPSLRADAGADFAAPVPQEARAGTRHNLLGNAVLDAAEFSVIALTAGGNCAARRLLEGGVAAGAGAAGAAVPVCVSVTLRGVTRQLALPLRWQLSGGLLSVSGETAVRQSDLGLTPFNTLLGALQVRDELQVRVRLLAHRPDSKARAATSIPSPPAARRRDTPCAAPR